MAALAVSLGDPAGIGPELLCEAWVRRKQEKLPPFFAVGGAKVLAKAAARRGLDVPIEPIDGVAAAAEYFPGALPVLGGLDGDYTPGQPDPDGARLALASLTEAVRQAVFHEAAGLVTGPVSKALLAEVGFAHPGQTEFVAEACRVDPEEAVMMLAGPQLKSVPLTVHCALSAVPGLLSAELICRKALVVDAALREDFGIAHPRIAIAALNPHAGEGGRMGDEERRIIIPAIEKLREAGIDASGPYPADALFAPHARSQYDVALAMYHDQALIPLKALDFDQGVNMTLGLPIVRTSPDHGTAFAIAGTCKAHPGATIAAVRMAGAAAVMRARA